MEKKSVTVEGSAAVGNVSIPTDQLIQRIPELAREGVTEFFLHDRTVAGNRKYLSSLIETVLANCPDMFLSLTVDLKLIDVPFIQKLSSIYCSIDIPLEGTEKAGGLLLDKKLYASKTRLLDRDGIVFGFVMGWGVQSGDTFKSFRDRLDFAVSLSPNHIEFPQFSAVPYSPAPTGFFSSKDMDFACGMAFACRTFYTEGRAMPWFNAVIKPLHISPSAFFADFDEWQQCNNCSLVTEYVPEDVSHQELEQLQLRFLEEKYREKHKEHVFPAVRDFVVLNGAFSRVVEEDEESVVETSYNPDDLLSPYSCNLEKFAEESTEEHCSVKVFAGEDAPDYRIL